MGVEAKLSTVATPEELAERVKAILRTEHALDDPLRPDRLLPELPGERFYPERDLDLLDWGAVVGLAFGLARMEDPCESLEEVGERSYQAAVLSLGSAYSDVLERLGRIPATIVGGA